MSGFVGLQGPTVRPGTPAFNVHCHVLSVAVRGSAFAQDDDDGGFIDVPARGEDGLELTQRASRDGGGVRAYR